MDTYNTNRALICLDEVDEKYDSENEIVWQDDDYIRPIKDITGAEWEEAVYKDISPLIVLVHNRYKSVRYFQSLFSGYIRGYGMTETTSVVSVESQLGGPRHTGSAGMLVPGVKCQIVSVDTLERLPPKQLGEICVRGPNIMQDAPKSGKEDDIDEITWQTYKGQLTEKWLDTGPTDSDCW
ncbi:hypothetical protein POM88_006148 [Heracleum sosnowskyi]|uniref:AMP-dependent synthetase/ligase domain-containing protein n=1 Tax=Heracleum sosnowskyi TaxID=360622 RepID=A0AAD8MZS4_9APIA|nr:hypothetical protein POM88_006148 [Heracleum sosnowskyi]